MVSYKKMHSFLINYLLLLLLTVLFHFSTFSQASSSLHHFQPPASSEEVLSEDKSRLGSMPPSCHNSCNGCHPCMATQIPTLPSHHQVAAELTRSQTRPSRVFDSSPSQLTQYSNYKPMGWKCRCNGHFYNP